MAAKQTFSKEQVEANLIPDSAELESYSAPTNVNRKLIREGVPIHRSEKRLAYEAFVRDIRSAERGGDKALVEEIARDNKTLLECRTNPMTVGYPTVMTNMSIAYANDDYVATRLLPVISTGGKLSAVYLEMDRRARIAYPDDTAGSSSDGNELHENGSWTEINLKPRVMKRFLDALIVQNQTKPLDELMLLSTHPRDGLDWNRERRVATLLGATATFGSGHYTTLTGDSCWDSANGGDPAAVIDTGLATLWSGLGPGDYVGWCSLAVYNILKRHPRIADFYKYTGRSMFASPELLADYLGLDELVVCRAKKDTANTGGTETIGRLWNNTFGIQRRSSTPALFNASLGYIIEDGDAKVEIWFAQDRGVRGEWAARASRCDVEKITCQSCGYLITPLAAGA